MAAAMLWSPGKEMFLTATTAQAPSSVPTAQPMNAETMLSAYKQLHTPILKLRYSNHSRKILHSLVEMTSHNLLMLSLPIIAIRMLLFRMKQYQVEIPAAKSFRNWHNSIWFLLETRQCLTQILKGKL